MSDDGGHSDDGEDDDADADGMLVCNLCPTSPSSLVSPSIPFSLIPYIQPTFSSPRHVAQRARGSPGHTKRDRHAADECSPPQQLVSTRLNTAAAVIKGTM